MRGYSTVVMAGRGRRILPSVLTTSGPTGSGKAASLGHPYIWGSPPPSPNIASSRDQSQVVTICQ